MPGIAFSARIEVSVRYWGKVSDCQIREDDDQDEEDVQDAELARVEDPQGERSRRLVVLESMVSSLMSGC